ncbi:MAG: acyl-CoA dehydrogenase [Chloroflexi bacterium HGW-Chloroflexi-1]|nr:MAG: acyl-CoA dehydrogenase [Chloroflexi bacterium HGW-Chloroflexi-1]
MAENFFTDNLDLQFRLDQLDLSQVVEISEDGYRYHDQYPLAPRNYADAKDNYRLLLNVLGEICATCVAPRAAEADEEGAQFHDGRVTYAAATQEALDLLRQAELTGTVLPWEYGGLNLPGTIYRLMIEIVSRAEAGLMTVFGLQEIAATIEEFGSEAMKARLLPRFARGEVTGAMVLTEPDAGSDLGAVQTRATLRAEPFDFAQDRPPGAAYAETTGGWRLNGVKRFITNGGADVLLVLARSEPESKDARGLSLFLVEADETVHIRRIEHKLGVRSSPTCEIQFSDTPAQLIGKRRFGLIRYAMSMMNGARLAVAAQALGIAEAAYREASRYAEKRVQFGQPIRAIPAVYRMLLSMRGEIEATRALVCETGRWVDLHKAYEQCVRQGENPDPADRQRHKQADRLATVLTPLAKYYATEMGNRVCYQAMQIHGGAGYMREFNVERHYRDVRVTSIYEGTSQLQIVASTGGLLGHALDDLLNEWAALDYGAELAALQGQVAEATALLNQCIDRLKGEKERALIDYYAADLADVAVYVINCWLMLRDARLAGRKREMARVYIAETLPKIRGKAAVLQAIDPAPLQARDLILAESFDFAQDKSF